MAKGPGRRHSRTTHTAIIIIIIIIIIINLQQVNKLSMNYNL